MVCMYVVIAFVINHSFHYTLAFLASVIEFWTESFLFGASKRYTIIICFGLVLVIGGQVIYYGKIIYFYDYYKVYIV